MATLTLDTEFDGMNGALLSLALYRDDGKYIYVANATAIKDAKDPWVIANVIPHIEANGINPEYLTPLGISNRIEQFLNSGGHPHVISDWPSDLIHLNEALITGPGTMIDIPGITMEVQRVDAYPNNYKGLTQHNALSDAIALHLKLSENRILKDLAASGSDDVSNASRFNPAYDGVTVSE